MALQFKHDKQTPWDLQFMQFQDFVFATRVRSGISWTILVGADLVVGGIDFSDNFLYVPVIETGIP